MKELKRSWRTPYGTKHLGRQCIRREVSPEHVELSDAHSLILHALTAWDLVDLEHMFTESVGHHRPKRRL